MTGIRFMLIFFFQAEDGIRGFHVTGVQTCALPISSYNTDMVPQTLCATPRFTFTKSTSSTFPAGAGTTSKQYYADQDNNGDGVWEYRLRSEERREGKARKVRVVLHDVYKSKYDRKV